jgi:hypothetical protein
MYVHVCAVVALYDDEEKQKLNQALADPLQRNVLEGQRAGWSFSESAFVDKSLPLVLSDERFGGTLLYAIVSVIALVSND